MPILIMFTLIRLMVEPLYTNAEKLDILSYWNNYVKAFVKQVSQAYMALSS